MKVSIETIIDSTLEKVWSAWTTPAYITAWNFASEEWCCPKTEIDLEPGKNFNYRMEAKDGSMGFDFSGTFTEIKPNEFIEYALEDGRRVSISFEQTDNGVRVVESFDAEDENSAEQQKQGWQCILNNFKAHVESTSTSG
ncbi:MAG: ATPase [Halobacteriovoraceae bacterium]|nr:ATPase [Halobacteriovoraceae bacterium]|tara:strand:- start:290859 stop:291278 length:420 start_codon:yes stop_codon:yes gene_type:complete